MPIIELTIVPIGTSSTSLSSFVADLVKTLEQAPEPIHYELTAMSTIIEGTLTDLFAIIQRLHEVPFLNGAARVSTSIKIDDRRDAVSSIQQKLNSVSARLNLENP
jgi:uncharacterized protein (TIGR00106 family)